jgi:N-acetylglucosamine kinase-like BadF-type ATPase
VNYIGVDGGGTKTKIMLSNDVHILDEIIVGPTSIDTVSIEDMFYETLVNQKTNLKNELFRDTL